MIQPFTPKEETWQRLLDPLSSDNPCGAYLVYEDTYDHIQAARFEEDPQLPQGIWKRDIKRADWSKVESLCIEALCLKTKDLQIAAWLMEAWLTLYGMEGVIKGLTLIETYCQKYWEDIHPRIKEDDIEFRMAPFEWINEKFSEKIPLLPLTFNEASTYAYSLVDWQQANQMHGRAALLDKKRDTEGQPDITLADFKEASDNTPLSFYEHLIQNLQKAIDISISIESFIYQKYKDFPSHLNHLKSQINSVLTTAKMILKEKQGNISVFDPLSDTSSKIQDNHPQKLQALAFSSREEAYYRLGEIATYLSKIEPHSPTPFLLKRAISWGRMSVVDLLQEIVRDKNDYQNILQLLGVQKNETS